MPSEESTISPVWLTYLPNFLEEKVRNSSNLRRIIPNIGWLFFDKIVRMGIGLFVGVWVARYLGPEQFGLLSYALAFVALFSAVASLGLDGIVIRNIVRDPSSRDETLGTVLILKFSGAILAIILVLTSISFLRRGDVLTFWLVAIISSGMIFQSFDAIDFWFQSQVKSKYIVYARNAAFIIIAGIKVLLIIRKAPLVAFAYAGAVEVALASAGLVLAYMATGNHIAALRGSFSRARTLFKDSWPLIFSGIMMLVYLRIDQVMLGQMVGDAEVGIYSAAVRLAEVWYFIPIAICSSIFPSIVEAKQVNENLFYSKLQKLYNLMVFVGYLVAVPVTFAGSWLVTSLYGSAYLKAGPMLSVLIWAGVFVNLGVARSSFLTAMNWTKVQFFTVALGCVVNVVLNYLLIPAYGGMGAVIASCIAYWTAAHGACFVYKPLHKTGFMLTKALVFPRIS